MLVEIYSREYTVAVPGAVLFLKYHPLDWRGCSTGLADLARFGRKSEIVLICGLKVHSVALDEQVLS